MGAKVSNPKNQLLQEQAEEVIEYEGYEEFPIIEVAKNIVMKNDKVRPNPSLNNHSGGSSIGKYESENYLNKYKDKLENNVEENNKVKDESKFKKEPTEQKDEENNINKENNNIIINNVEEMKEQEKEDILRAENNNQNKVEINIVEKKPEEIDENNGGNLINDNNKELNGNINNINTDNINDNLNNAISEIKEEDINNDNEEKEKINNDENNNNYEEKKIENEELNNNNDINEKEINKTEEKNENDVNIINDDLAPKKIFLPDITTIISEKVLEEGAGNELLFMSYLNKIVHISIKEKVKYSQKFCITSKDNFLIYENKDNYIQVKKPLAIIPISSIKNVVMFKLSKKIPSYDHFYIEFDLDENNRNNVINKIDTFYENDLDNKTNENLTNTALVMFKTDEKNLAKEWYVLLRYLINLKLKQ